MSIASRINEMTEHLRNDWNSIDKLGLDITEENSNDNLDKNIENIAPVLGKFYNQVSDKTNLSENGIVGRTSQDGDPTPENPVEINNLSGDVEYRVRGKNLFVGVFRQGNQHNNWNTSRIFSNKNDWKVNVGDKFTFSTNLDLTTFDYSFYIMQYPYLSVSSNTMLYTSNYQATNTFTINCEYEGYLGFTIRKKNESNITPSDVSNYWFQIEKGTTATSYEPYISESFPLSLGDIELCNISDYKDRIYSQNGEFYLEKKTGKVVFDGSEDWSIVNSTATNRVHSTPSVVVNPNGELLSNYFTYNTNTWRLSDGTTGIYRIASSGNIIISDTIRSNEEFKAWLSTHNTIVYYVLPTPTNTEITSSNYPALYAALKEIQDYLVSYKINKEFLLDYSSPEIEY